MLTRLIGVERLPESVVRQLVASLYSRWEPVGVGYLVCTLFGLFSYSVTSSRWYLVGVAYIGVVSVVRMQQFKAFHRTGGAGSPAKWAMRHLVTGWATALGWAGWAPAIYFEHDPAVGGTVLALLASLMCGAAVRTSGVLVVAYGQILIPAVALIAACALSDNVYLRFDSLLVVLMTGAALGLSRSLHRQTFELLSAGQQAAELAAELALVNEHLSEQAAADPLTNLLNRRALELAASREWLAAARDRRPTSVLMLDIDHFKSFNDHYGHPAGDKCLRDVSAVLASVVRRPSDILARYGGEEFIAVLPAVDLQGAETVATNILDQLRVHDHPHAASPFGRITASIGVACSTGSTATSIGGLIAEADSALYRAKRNGRNQISAYLQPHLV